MSPAAARRPASFSLLRQALHRLNTGPLHGCRTSSVPVAAQSFIRSPSQVYVEVGRYASLSNTSVAVNVRAESILRPLPCAEPLRPLDQESRAGWSPPQPDARPPPFTLTARLAFTCQAKGHGHGGAHGHRPARQPDHRCPRTRLAAIQDTHPDVTDVVIVTGAGSNQKGTPRGYQLRGHHWPERRSWATRTRHPFMNRSSEGAAQAGSRGSSGHCSARRRKPR
jgi:hypothetical protein